MYFKQLKFTQSYHVLFRCVHYLIIVKYKKKFKLLIFVAENATSVQLKPKCIKFAVRSLKRNVVEALQSTGHLYDRAIYLWTGCAEHAEQQLITNPDNETVDEITNLIKKQ